MRKQAIITALVGSYRVGGVIDQAVDEILAAAAEKGAMTQKIRLMECHIEFCRNCRSCTQQPGETPGICPIQDDMNEVLNTIHQSDVVVLASPMNFGSVTAVTKRFIERLVCFAYWPWGMAAPKQRVPVGNRKGILIVSSAAPCFLAHLNRHMIKLMKSALRLLGVKSPVLLCIGMCAQEEHPSLSNRIRAKARKLGESFSS